MFLVCNYRFNYNNGDAMMTKEMLERAGFVIIGDKVWRLGDDMNKEPLLLKRGFTYTVTKRGRRVVEEQLRSSTFLLNKVFEILFLEN